MKKPTELARLCRRKLGSAGGLTLVELLITVVLVSIAGGIIVATVDLASKQLRTRAQESDAQLLCSALSLFMQNELTYAGDVKLEGGKVTFTDNANGLGKNCTFETNGDGHVVMLYSGGSYDPVGAGDYGGESAHKEFKAEQTVEPDDGGDANNGERLKVNVKVRDAKTDAILAESTFRVKPIAPGSGW